MNIRLYLKPTLRVSAVIPPVHYAFRAWRLIRHRDFKFLSSSSTILKNRVRKCIHSQSAVQLLDTNHALAEICHSRQHILSHTLPLLFHYVFSILKIVSDNNCRPNDTPVSTLGAKFYDGPFFFLQKITKVLFPLHVEYWTDMNLTPPASPYSIGPRFKSLTIGLLSCRFRIFLRSLQANIGIVPKTDHDSFLSFSFKFIIHQSLLHHLPHSVISAAYRVLKQTINDTTSTYLQVGISNSKTCNCTYDQLKQGAI
jgi:hypothetical protein